MGNRTLLGVTGAVLMGLALAGCSSSDDTGVATAAGGDQGATAAAASPSTSLSVEDQRLAFTQCLRDHGIDVPDQGAQPSPGSVDFSSKTFQQAFAACRDKLPADSGFGPGASMSADQQAKFLKMAACMREEGIDVPDPKFDANGGLDLGALATKINPTDPKVRKALQTCAKQVGLQMPGAPQ